MFFISQVERVQDSSMVVTIKKGQIGAFNPPEDVCVEGFYEGFALNPPVNLNLVAMFKKSHASAKVNTKSSEFPLLPDAIFPTIGFWSADGKVIAKWVYPPNDKGTEMRNEDYEFICSKTCEGLAG